MSPERVTDTSRAHDVSSSTKHLPADADRRISGIRPLHSKAEERPRQPQCRGRCPLRSGRQGVQRLLRRFAGIRRARSRFVLDGDRWSVRVARRARILPGRRDVERAVAARIRLLSGKVLLRGAVAVAAGLIIRGLLLFRNGFVLFRRGFDVRLIVSGCGCGCGCGCVGVGGFGVATESRESASRSSIGAVSRGVGSGAGGGVGSAGAGSDADARSSVSPSTVAAMGESMSIPAVASSSVAPSARDQHPASTRVPPTAITGRPNSLRRRRDISRTPLRSSGGRLRVASRCIAPAPSIRSRYRSRTRSTTPPPTNAGEITLMVVPPGQMRGRVRTSA